jgi:preprotein translocase subunit SecA
MGLFDAIFGTYSERELKKNRQKVRSVLALAQDFKKKSEGELRGMTDLFQKRLADGETLDAILPEAFATVREASTRVLGMTHFPVQVEGGIVLHQGRIAEMRTGEGKTLVATLPVYLNALTGKGVHVVTVNDYLAKRDSEWMGKIYRYLGLDVGLIVHGLDKRTRRASYAADVTYGTNNEFGFDYLRDNMVLALEDCVQRSLHFAIVDEVDSILIDEARTPLIISGAGTDSSALYLKTNDFVRGLREKRVIQDEAIRTQDELEELESGADYIVDEKARSAVLTERGVAKAERFLNLKIYPIRKTTI